MKLVFECPNCKTKKVEIKSESQLGDFTFRVLSCGHVLTEKKLPVREIKNKLLDGRSLYPFQRAGCEFTRDNNFRVLIADEMGLGKTIQVVALLLNFPELRPALLIVKASTTINWMREIFNGAGLISQILDTDSIALTGAEGNGKFNIKIDCYLTSYDSLVTKPRKKPGIVNKAEPAKWRKGIKYNLLVLDEVQMIKNHDSKRTQQVRDLARDTKHIIELSGTPIKNNAAEYFPALNILDPVKYSDRTYFIRFDTNSFWDGYRYRVGGLRDPERFAEKNKNLIIRRTRKEVLPDLPETRISLRYTTMLDEAQKAYDKEVDDFTDFMTKQDSSKATEQEYVTNILAYMNKMRHITGLAKVGDVLDFVIEFLEDRESEEKLTIFHHHKDVGEVLVEKIREILNEREYGEAVTQLKAEQDGGKRQEIIDQFKDSTKTRILIAPTLACGEGINLQFCNTAVLAEREWNPANEEQAAPGRFSRIGSIAQFVDVIISVAINSIDELFAEYVERKRQYVTETLDGKKLDLDKRWNQSQIIKEIGEKLVQQNLKSWRQRVRI